MISAASRRCIVLGDTEAREPTANLPRSRPAREAGPRPAGSVTASGAD